MRILSQIHHSTLAALGSLTQQKHRSTVWMGIYLLVGLAVFSLFSWLFWQYQDDLKQMLLSYLFPDSWHTLSESVVEYFFSTQAKVVLSNLVLGCSLVIASVFLFPLKEKYSAHFESEQHYPNGTPHEFPLIRQAKEEIRLFLFYVTSQLIILWIGYYPFAWAKITSISLSYLALIIMFSMDLISPTFHRHQVGYSRMIIVLMRNPFATLCFGAIYSVPAVLLSYGITRFTELTFLEMSSWLFITNILFICIAIPGGTHVASQLLPENQHVKPFTLSTKRISYALMVILLITFGILHGRLAQSLHHKSQILKAEYEVD